MISEHPHHNSYAGDNMKRILITGANRGVGLELTLQLAARGDRIFAGCRSPEKADGLEEIAARYPGKVTILPLEVTEQGSIAESAARVAAEVEALTSSSITLAQILVMRPAYRMSKPRSCSKLSTSMRLGLCSWRRDSSLCCTKAWIPSWSTSLRKQVPSRIWTISAATITMAAKPP